MTAVLKKITSRLSAGHGTTKEHQTNPHGLIGNAWLDPSFLEREAILSALALQGRYSPAQILDQAYRSVVHDVTRAYEKGQLTSGQFDSIMAAIVAERLWQHIEDLVARHFSL